MGEKIAVVTGGNRGIGLEVCRSLSLKGYRVFLTGRDASRLEKAAADLGKLKAPVETGVLDVSSEASRVAFASWLSERTTSLDVLVNNAGVFLDEHYGGTGVPPALVRETFEINVLGAWHLVQLLLPLLKRTPGARVINVSSGLGAMSEMSGGYAAYRVSKVALNAVTRILASELEPSGVSVNSVCPGWVQTEMGGPGAPLTVEVGADSIVWLATEPVIPTGRFFRDRRSIPW
ncbi:MAG: Rhamnolipids biosynthesis 3-oxoacyl-[acyl-carrier-protein] reductase [Thermoanaerobaculia bacterium]|nr:Rhamnolipids biosynthesis 3-oxoacyl-[acyl-carrier-protein] reductase [Thermoanaerobaculia bacterium]